MTVCSSWRKKEGTFLTMMIINLHTYIKIINILINGTVTRRTKTNKVGSDKKYQRNTRQKFRYTQYICM